MLDEYGDFLTIPEICGILDIGKFYHRTGQCFGFWPSDVLWNRAKSFLKGLITRRVSHIFRCILKDSGIECIGIQKKIIL